MLDVEFGVGKKREVNLVDRLPVNAAPERIEATCS
jgi:hypothetical protein